MKFIFLLIPPSPPNTVFTRLQPATGATASAVVPSPTASQFQRKIPSFRNTGHGVSAAELAEFQQQVAMAQPSATGGQASASHHQSNAGVGELFINNRTPFWERFHWKTFKKLKSG